MTKTIQSVALIFSMNERLFVNALEGVNEEQAKDRISDHNNPLIWIAAHTVWARYNLLFFLGAPALNPYESFFENFRAFNMEDDLPSLEAVKEEWLTVSTLLNKALLAVSEEHLAAESMLKSPIGDFTNAGTVSFLAQHESYDIGQMALLKKLHSRVAMKY